MDEEKKTCCRCCSPPCKIAVFVIGLLFVVAGVVLFFFSPAIFQNIIDQQVVLKPGSPSFDNWRDIPAATYMSFRVFDLKNPKEVIATGARPAVEEAGILAYRESLNRVDVQSHQNGSVTYKQPRSFYFDPERSTVSPNKTITTINIPLLAIFLKLENLPAIAKKIIDELTEILDGPLFIEKTVEELIWGYEDPLLKRLAPVVKRLLNISIESRIGLFFGRNGTDDGVYNVFSGEKDVTSINSIFTWNNNLNLPYWNTGYANMINGTDGTLFHPGLQPSEVVYLFSTDVCRSLFATYTSSIRNAFDIDVMRYEIPLEVFADHHTVPSNADFCTPPGNCLKAGVLNVSICRQGLPAVISLPHFYLADPSYQEAIAGLHPEHDLHASFFDIEPLTGAVLNASKRLQINVPLRRVDGPIDMQNLPNETFFFPVAWLCEEGQLDAELADEFKDQVYAGRTLLTIVAPSGLLALGFALVMVIVCIGLASLRCGNDSNQTEDRRSLITTPNQRTRVDVIDDADRPDGMVNAGTTPIEQSMNTNRED